MKVIHSFWTRPLQISLYGVDRLHHLVSDIWMFSLSLAYLKRGGIPAELHTDPLGAALLGHLPYDDVHLSLRDIPQEISPRFWAAGKIWALEAANGGCTEPVIHIDGDVFIKDPAALDGARGAAVFAQEIEHGNSWLWRPDQAPEPGDVDGWRRFCLDHGLHECGTDNFNTGVVAVNDPALLAEWVAGYRAFAEAASIRYAGALASRRNITPDLVSEQMLLYQLWLHHNRKGQCGSAEVIFPGGSWVPGAVIAKNYQHLVTARKYEPEIIDKVRRSLRIVNSEIYNKTLSVCQNI